MTKRPRYKVAVKLIKGMPYAYLQQTLNRGPGKSPVSQHVAYLGRAAPNTRLVLPDHLAELTGQRAVLIPALTPRQLEQVREPKVSPGKPRLPRCRHCGGQVMRFPALDGEDGLRCVQCGRKPARAAARGDCQRCGGRFLLTGEPRVIQAHVAPGTRATLCAGSGRPPQPEPEVRVRGRGKR